ncbi:MAG: hypothetical protein HY304_06670 [candidate division Zixibacteria bacterium]|nr:hypothetical protein [candidate division Zixibacteria bacterium]
MLAVAASANTCPAEDFGSALLEGVAGAYTAALDAPGGVWSNPALPALADQHGAAELSYRRLFNLEEFDDVTAAARLNPGHHLAIGGGMSRFGQSELYVETRGVISAARTIWRQWALGAGLQVERTEFGQAVSRFAGTYLNLGMAARPRSDLAVGLAVRHLTINRLYGDDDRAPTYEISAAWTAPPDLTLAGIWSKHSGDDDQWGIGQRLRLVSGIEFLSGLRLNPTRYSLGGRISRGGGSINYVYLSHADLGGTHTIGMGWQW